MSGLLAAITVGLLSVGCAIFDLSDDSDTPFASGYGLVEVYIVSRPLIAAEHQLIIGQIYDLAIASDDLEALTDQILSTTIAELFPDASTEKLAVLLVVFQKAKDRLIGVIQENTDLDSPVIIGQFLDGMRAAVADYDLRATASGLLADREVTE